MVYRLTAKAEVDIIAIAEVGLFRWGRALAEEYIDGLYALFDRIARSPRMARERNELTPPVRIKRYRAHLVLYLIEGDDILILRLRHGREDWQSDL
ncbi:MAG: type II toxin-antitoxin system RelE/ParE family toxin [Rhizobium rhizophilum]